MIILLIMMVITQKSSSKLLTKEPLEDGPHFRPNYLQRRLGNTEDQLKVTTSLIIDFKVLYRFNYF